jgi:glycosyltransferase involved in cell wall biosynthesis
MQKQSGGLQGLIHLRHLSVINPERISCFLAAIERRPLLIFLFNLGMSAVLRMRLLAREVVPSYRKRRTVVPAAAEKQEVDGPLPRLASALPVPERPDVLLIVEESMAACFRYRVQQKVEQLRYLGCRVQWRSWKDVAACREALHFCHVVIFYRVPAFPEPLRIIRLAQALNKVVFFDIDDLIFDGEHYPGRWEDYKGSLSRAEYQGLVNGVGLYRQALAECSFAIASTPSLAERMERVVGFGKTFVHRNGLDEPLFNFLAAAPRRWPRPFTTIFYGSGTRTHDADFQVAVPALCRLLQRHPQVRLILVGHLTMPTELKPFLDRIIRIRFLESAEVYWELLAQADISIAPLKEGVFEDCKSEIKWLEAAALHVPSVVSATRTYQEILEDGADACLARDDQQWLQSLEALVVDPQKRLAMAQQANEKALDRYGRDRQAGSLRACLQEAIQQEVRAGHVRHEQTGRIRLLFVNIFYPPQGFGGATVVMHNLVRELRQSYPDYELQVFSYDLERQGDYTLTEEVHEGVHVTRIALPPQARNDWNYRDERVYALFRRYLLFHRPHLVHFHSIQRLTASMTKATADLHIPYLVTLHDAWWICDHQFLVDRDGGLCEPLQDPFQAPPSIEDLGAAVLRRRYLSDCLQKAEALLAVSAFQAELYRRAGFAQVRVDTNGLLPPSAPACKASGPRLRLGYAGGVSMAKGYDLLKESTARAGLVHSEVLMIDFSLAAGQRRRETWGKTAVTVLPAISPEQMIQEFFAQVDVVVIPSLAPESFGLIVREAILAGVWVLTSNRGALAEAVEEGINGFVFDPQAPAELIRLLRFLDGHPARFRERTRCAGQRKIRTVAQQVAGLDQLYRELLRADTTTTAQVVGGRNG